MVPFPIRVRQLHATVGWWYFAQLCYTGRRKFEFGINREHAVLWLSHVVIFVLKIAATDMVEKEQTLHDTCVYSLRANKV
jgi:hypothetical protein